ncbi:MAG: glutamate-5-semialdehyde dehydrogenase [Lachnospiraceae bacterium]|nr:glutamate-5-semialdehyde dehydrogenase [Lachnospiraceae bacterium]
MTTLEILQRAKAAAPALSAVSTEQKNEALRAMAESLLAHTDGILEENSKDMEDAKGRLSDAMMDRLLLNEERLSGMADGIRDVCELPDPVGHVLEEIRRPNGLVIQKVTVPMGVIAVIYESRPNVTSDVSALCLKSGSACILRTGRDAFRTANAIAEALKEALALVGLTPDLIQLIQDTSRESANELMQARDYVDLLIPRGGAGLIKNCVENATVNVIQTGTGICHVYVDGSADPEMAVNIVENAKASRPSVCNAEEVCLVHRDIAEEFLPALKQRLVDDRMAAGLTPVELRLDERAMKIIPGTAAGPDDFDTEFLDYILAVGIVDSAEEAIAHIAEHSTGHSESIVTGEPETAELFLRCVDSAAVYVNASTRFTDGGEFGLGCEIGISTQKMHARGPMGLEALTTYKYIIRGDGQCR